MALIPVTVFKYRAAAECFLPEETDYSLLAWLYPPQDCFAELEKIGKDFPFIKTNSHLCLKDNYCVAIDYPVVDSFNGEALDGVEYQIDYGGMDLSILGCDKDDFDDSGRNESIQDFINTAEKLVKDLMERREKGEPNFWWYKFHTAWKYWGESDYWGDFDCGINYVGVMDITDDMKVTNITT